MHAHHAAFFKFREVTQSLSPLPVRQQILSLEYELFHALERAHDVERRARDLETHGEKLRTESVEREKEQDAFARTLHTDLLQATRALTGAKIEHDEETRKLRLSLASVKAQRDALDELCQSLVRTIEQAAEAEPSVPCEAPDARASA